MSVILIVLVAGEAFALARSLQMRTGTRVTVGFAAPTTSAGVLAVARAAGFADMRVIPLGDRRFRIETPYLDPSREQRLRRLLDDSFSIVTTGDGRTDYGTLYVSPGIATRLRSVFTVGLAAALVVDVVLVLAIVVSWRRSGRLAPGGPPPAGTPTPIL